MPIDILLTVSIWHFVKCAIIQDWLILSGWLDCLVLRLFV